MCNRLRIGLAAWLLTAAVRALIPPAAPPDPGYHPSAEVYRTLSLGRHTTAASVAWARAVSRFTRHPSDDLQADWLPLALEPIHALDPRWALPWTYGALMARHLQDFDTEQRLLLLGIDRFPDAYWFPYAMGMARYLQGDQAQAAQWLEHAAALPDAPQVTAEAARQLRQGTAP